MSPVADIRLIQQQDGNVSWRRESTRKGLNTTSGAQFAALPLVKMVNPVVWFARAVVNWRSRSVAKSAYLQENVNTYCRPIMTLSKTSPPTFYIYASNSLIIHKENTKEINVQWAFGNQMKNCLFFNPQYLLLKTFCLRRNIKHFPVYNLTRSPWMIWPLRSNI